MNKNVRDNCLANEQNWTLPCEPDECNSLEQSRCTEVESVPIVYTDPVSWWKFDETDGTSCLDSVGGYNLTTAGSPSFPVGKVGNALSVGSGGYAKNNTRIGMLQVTGLFSLEALVKLNSLPTVNYAYIIGDLVGTNANYGLRISETSGKVGFYFANSKVVESTIALTTGTWYHIVATKDGNIYKLYINNANVGNGTSSVGPTYGGDLLYVGWIGSGLTDEVAVYNVALTEAEIAEHYNNVFSDNENYFGD